jgi:hypothetical protein
MEIAALALLLTACGSAPPPAPAPKPSAPVVEAPLPAPALATPPDAGAADAPVVSEAPANAAPEPTETKRSQTPIHMLTAREAAFLVDYANSAPKQAAVTACEREAKGDAEKQGACLTKAREKFLPDVLRFRKDSETQTSLLIYKRNASALRELWVGVVELSEPSSDTVKVKLLSGRQKGTRPLWRGKSEVVINAPNEYSIEFDDPEFGHLRYDAKIGIVTE